MSKTTTYNGKEYHLVQTGRRLGGNPCEGCVVKTSDLNCSDFPDCDPRSERPNFIWAEERPPAIELNGAIGLNGAEYQLLNELDALTDCGLSELLNRFGLAHLSVCPSCFCDDFTHEEGCRLGEMK